MSKKIWYAPNGFEAYGDEEIEAVNRCLKEGWLAGNGKYTTQFEQEVASYFGKKFGLFVNSGSSACLLALASLNLPNGAEVITPACTFSTTVAPIIQLKLKPVFCDVDLNTYVASAEAVISKITPSTRVIMLPNLIGNTPDWKLLRRMLDDLGRSDIFLIEDSADTLVCTPETDISTTSFYASHVITACGSGGMVMFNDEKQLKRAIMFRDWGRIGDNSEDVSTRFEFNIDGIPYDYKFLYGAIGYNMKSSEMNAAFGLVQLSRIEEIKAKRRAVFQRYLERLQNVKELTLPIVNGTDDWLAIPFLTKDRIKLLTYLEENHIQTRVCFAGNITRHPVYRHYLQEFPNSDRVMAEGFLLGAHHGMVVEDVDYICDKMIEFFAPLNL